MAISCFRGILLPKDNRSIRSTCQAHVRMHEDQTVFFCGNCWRRCARSGRNLSSSTLHALSSSHIHAYKKCFFEFIIERVSCSIFEVGSFFVIKDIQRSNKSMGWDKNREQLMGKLHPVEPRQKNAKYLLDLFFFKVEWQDRSWNAISFSET